MSSRSIDPSSPSRSARTLSPESWDSRHRGDQDDSPEGRHPSRPSGQASYRPILSWFS